MLNTWLVLLPPFLVLGFAYLTQRLNASLILGIVSAALIATNFSPFKSAEVCLTRLWQTATDIDNITMFSFLTIISVIVVLINRSGGAQALAKSLTHKLTTSRGAQTTSIIISLGLFIDDYLSNLTVGYIMRPITDRFQIPRAKLAFLVHSLTSPLIILAPISSWVAAILSTLDQAGISTHTITSTKIIADPFFIYLQSIPYIFYSYLMIASVVFIVRSQISYGSMHTHEKIAQETGNLHGGKNPLEEKFDSSTHATGSLLDFFLPLSILLGSVIICTLYAGGYHLLGGSHSLLEAFKHNTNFSQVLLFSGLITLIISLISTLVRHKIEFKTIPQLFKDGFDLVSSAMIMIFLAFTLGKILRFDLQTGDYLATILQGIITTSLLPFIFYLISSITALLTGSAWGTMMLLIPIAVPMLTSFAHIPTPTSPESLAILFPVLGAIFSGAICGNHLSPISDTTIMASASSGAHPLDHARTQFPYAIPAIISTSLAYLISGFFTGHSMIFTFMIPLALSMILCLGILKFLNKKIS